jgi:uncharacterized protein
MAACYAGRPGGRDRQTCRLAFGARLAVAVAVLDLEMDFAHACMGEALQVSGEEGARTGPSIMPGGTKEAYSTLGPILESIAARLVREFAPERIILFGSYARGEANRWSDIDLLVVFAEPVDKRETAIAIRRLLRKLPVAKDVIVTDESELSRIGDLVGSVYRPALRDGKTIYERE